MSEVTKQYQDTLYYRVLEKMIPGLADELVAKNQRLCQYNLTGSVKMTLLGLESSARSWTDLLQIFNVSGFGDNVWAAKMLQSPPMQLKNFGHNSFLTTSSLNNFAGHTGRTRTPIYSLTDANVATGVDELSICQQIYETFTPKVIITHQYNMPASPNGIAAWNHSTLAQPKRWYSYQEDVTSDLYSLCASLVYTFGYTVARGMPVIHVWTSIGMPPETLTQTDLDNILTSRSGGSTTSNMLSNLWNGYGRKIAVPDVKYVPFLFNLNRQTQRISVVDNGENVGSFGMGAMFFMIPVVDDGTLSVTGYVSDHNNREWFIEFGDGRYTGAKAPTINMDKWYTDSILPDGYKKQDGTILPWADVPSTGYESTTALGTNFLPLLSVPLPEQHFVGSSVTRRVEQFRSGDQIVDIINYDMTVSFFATKVDKNWYKEYYQSGFGLYTPRASNIQANILKTWEGLNWDTMAICIDHTNQTISPQIVYQTDLAREYARAREKACKDNDWLQQTYCEGVTYKTIFDRITAKPKRQGFYSIMGMSTSTSFAPEPADGKWMMSGDGTSFIRSEGEGEDQIVETFSINEVSAELVLSELASGMMIGAGVEDKVAQVLELTADELNGINEAKKMGVDNGYLKEQSNLVGYVMKSQYFSPQQSLHRSGFPVYRLMQSPYREVMIFECYAQLDKMGDNMVKIITSFTSDVVINKILQKK